MFLAHRARRLTITPEFLSAPHEAAKPSSAVRPVFDAKALQLLSRLPHGPWLAQVVDEIESDIPRSKTAAAEASTSPYVSGVPNFRRERTAQRLGRTNSTGPDGKDHDSNA